MTKLLSIAMYGEILERGACIQADSRIPPLHRQHSYVSNQPECRMLLESSG